MNDLNDVAQELSKRERELIESDLRSLDITEADAGQYEIVYQTSPDTGVTVYRGISKHGRFVWDRHSEWPTTKGFAR